MKNYITLTERLDSLQTRVRGLENEVLDLKAGL